MSIGFWYVSIASSVRLVEEVDAEVVSVVLDKRSEFHFLKGHDNLT
jgi:hypothetical protein